MIKRAVVVAVFGIAIMVSGCATRIGPGHVGIKIDLAGSQRGAEDLPLRTGWVLYNPFASQVVEYPTFVQTYGWTANPNEGAEGHPPDESITFTDKNSVRINADISLSYQLDAQKVPNFYIKFRSDDLNNFTFGFLHNVARDAFTEIGGHYVVEQIMGDNEQFLHDVRDRISSQVMPYGVLLIQMGFIGAPRPPQTVVDSINNAQQAKYIAQQKENELKQAQADAAKVVAKADGDAQANRKLAESITPQLLQWRSMDIQTRWIDKWNGQRPSVESGSGGGMIIQVPGGK
jgi:regulator of protease activity HflC (stomatin/prohibitin superfamily)